MQLLPQDRRYLDRALTLAEDAAAFASPNPTVGCVLVRGPQASSRTIAHQPEILGEGAHLYDRRDHAEIAALKAAASVGHNLRGATGYVTLEPCSHHGRTGPCADALIVAGVARCVVATVDPNPLVRGQGIVKLRAAGVEVDLLDPADPLAQRARRLNDAFAFSIQHGRPFVTLKAAVSRDGKLAPHLSKRLTRSDTGSEPFWLTGPAAREDVQRLRHQSDAILTGIGTVLADDPSLTDRTGLPRRNPLNRVVLDAHLRIPLTSTLVSSAQNDLLILCAQTASQANEQALVTQGAEVVRLPSHNGHLDLNHVFAALGPCRSLLVEAGSTLNTTLLGQSLVDRLILYTAPVDLGPTALPFAYDQLLPAIQQELTGATERSFPNGEAEDLRLTGYLHDPWHNI